MRKAKKWIPAKGGEYWYWHSSYERGIQSIWNDGDVDMRFYRKGNVHPTREAAEKWGKDQEETK